MLVATELQTGEIARKQHAIFSQTFNSVKLVLGIFNFWNGPVKAKSLIPQGN